MQAFVLLFVVKEFAILFTAVVVLIFDFWLLF